MAVPIEFVRQVPPHLWEAFQNGTARVAGSIVQNVETGRIMGLLQATSSSVPKAAGRFVLGLNPLSMITDPVMIFQNFQMDAKLKELISMMGGLQQGMNQILGLQALNLGTGLFSVAQNAYLIAKMIKIEGMLELVVSLQVATLLGSGLTFGATVLSKAMILRRLSAIQQGITRLDQTFRDARAHDWQRRVNTRLKRLDEQVNILDALPLKTQPTPTAILIEGQIANLIGDLRECLHDRLTTLPSDRAEAARAVDQSIEVERGLNLARHIQLRALLEAEELGAAHHIALRHRDIAIKAADEFEPVALLIGTNPRAPDDDTARLAATLQMLHGSLIQSAMSLNSYAVLIRHLARQNWSARDYLAQARREDLDPVTMVVL